ncbi:MAG: hypothetical protein P9L97_02595 [Candidatus Tenebribacter davisii]|jgi:hypothetical protein|nr:hypothetical protein [Candidatus Tenebribacter davisii]
MTDNKMIFDSSILQNISIRRINKAKKALEWTEKVLNPKYEDYSYNVEEVQQLKHRKNRLVKFINRQLSISK